MYIGLLVYLHYSHKITLLRYTGGSFVRLFTQRDVKTNCTDVYSYVSVTTQLCHYTFVHKFDKCWPIFTIFHSLILHKICNKIYVIYLTTL